MDKTNEWIKHMSKWRSKEYATARTNEHLKQGDEQKQIYILQQ